MGVKERFVFLTGATGYLGCHLAYGLLQQGCRVVALVRGEEEETAVSRLQAAILQVNPMVPPDFSRLLVVLGDVEETAVSLIHKVRQQITDPIDEVWHCVATFKYQEHERDYIHAINIGGVENVMAFVLRINQTAPPRYFHVSTAYSSGRDCLVVPEAIVSNGSTQGFRSLYEWSKHEGEKVVAREQQCHQLDVTILRPAIIIGSEKTQVFNHSAYYQVISAVYRVRKHLENRQKNFDGTVNTRLVGDPNTTLNLVPVDYVVDTMLQLAQRPELATPLLKIYNIVNEEPPTMELVHRVLCETLGIRGLTLVPLTQFDMEGASRIERALARNVAFQMPYMHEEIRFSTENLRQVLPYTTWPVVQVDARFLTKINRAFFGMLAERMENGRF